MKGNNPSSNILARQTLRLFWHATWKYPHLALLSLLLPLGAVLISIGVPFLVGKTLAGLVHNDPHTNTYVILIAICSLLGALGNRFGFTRNMVLQARVMTDLHSMLFQRLLQRSIGFHTNRISGKLISDAIDFVAAYSTLAAVGFISGFSFLMIIVIGLAVVLISSWPVGIFLLLTVTLTLGWTWRDSRRRATLRNTRLIATKNLTAHLSDTVVNAQTVKTFAQETAEQKRNMVLNKKLEALRIHDWQWAGRSANTRMTVLLALQLCMILLVIYLTRQHPATLATGIFAFTYTLTLTNRLYEINTITRIIEESLLNASPMTKMLQETVEIEDAPGAKDLRVNRGTIALQGVSFAYADSSNQVAVFEDFTLHVAPGERIGLVGPSGGGKSTLTRLLLRFDDVQQGTIKIDGQNISAVTQASLRRAIAYVPQEPLLFHRSIRENIAYGKPGASQKQIEAAAKKARAQDFIQQLPKGYDTVVGERGVKLSGGQRQRVAIARALLKDAPILILDEATSALDSESEVQVQEALWELMRGRTALVIAHRLSTIQKMDRILVLDNGAITEQGTHKQLKSQKGLYARLWAHQSGGFIEE